MNALHLLKNQKFHRNPFALITNVALVLSKNYLVSASGPVFTKR